MIPFVDQLPCAPFASRTSNFIWSTTITLPVRAKQSKLEPPLGLVERSGSKTQICQSKKTAESTDTNIGLNARTGGLSTTITRLKIALLSAQVRELPNPDASST